MRRERVRGASRAWLPVLWVMVTACGGGGDPEIVVDPSLDGGTAKHDGASNDGDPGAKQDDAGDPGPIITFPAGAAGSLQFVLSASVATTLAPFALGQVFKRGDIPAGMEVVGDLPDLQGTIKSRWPDGSAKLAVIAGRATLAADTPKIVKLTAAAPTMKPALTEAQLKSTGISAVLAFSCVGSVELSSLIGVLSTYDAAAGHFTAGLARAWVAGPQMSSWLYQAPIAGHAHLTAWFEVRYFADGSIFILPWIENARLGTAAPTSYTGVLSLQINGVQRFSQNVTVVHHTRAVAASGASFGHWAAPAPGIRFAHDTDYLQQTRVVPTYLAAIPTNGAVLDSFVKAYVPFAQADFPDDMTGTGYASSIGLLPEWEVAYLASKGDSRAQTAVIVNAESAGRYAIHYRDEKTNAPVRASDHPNLCLAESGPVGVSSAGNCASGMSLPAPSGTAPPTWDTAHHPSIGYTASLVTGSAYFLEELQFAATTNYLKQTDTSRQGAKGVLRTDVGALTTRGAAWALRTLSQAASISPTDDPIRADLLAQVVANIDYYHHDYIEMPSNPQGICRPYSDYTAGDGKYMHASWMEDFLTASWGYLISQGIEMSDASRTKLTAFFVWKTRSIVGRLGVPGKAGDYNLDDAAPYNLAVAPSDTVDWAGGTGPWYATWEDIYSATMGKANTTAAGDGLRGAYYPEPTSYWGNLQPAIAYAVEHATPGAAAAYQRMILAPNWAEIVTGWNDKPVWSVRPWTATPTGP